MAMETEATAQDDQSSIDQNVHAAQDKHPVTKVTLASSTLTAPVGSAARRRKLATAASQNKPTDTGARSDQLDSSRSNVTGKMQSSLSTSPTCTQDEDNFGCEQLKDPLLRELGEFLASGKLPSDETRVRKMALQSSQFTLTDGIVYRVNPKSGRKSAVVPNHMCQTMLRESHARSYIGHFSGRRLYLTLLSSWWWEGMYSDAEKFVRSCPECITVSGTGQRNKPPLHPIPVQRPFQVLGIDVMDLPITKQGNKHVVVIQDLFTKWLPCPGPEGSEDREADCGGGGTAVWSTRSTSVR